MSQLNPEIDHLLRRAGFGASAADAEVFSDMSTTAAIAMARPAKSPQRTAHAPPPAIARSS